MPIRLCRSPGPGARGCALSRSRRLRPSGPGAPAPGGPRRRHQALPPRLRPSLRPRSSTTRATRRASRRSPPRPAIQPSGLALEWASLRADAHPSFASLGAFLEAHPRWPSRGWIRERQEAELAAHPQRRPRSRRFFAGGAAAIERGKDRRGARGERAGARRGGGANHPRLVARRQFRRPDREPSSCAISALR